MSGILALILVNYLIPLLNDPVTVILVTGLLLAVAAALPGCFLVLRGTALLTDAISHSVVFGIALVWLATGLVSGPLQVLGAAAAGLVCVLATEALGRSGRMRMDAAMGLIFPTLFAAGVLIINLFARAIHLDVDTVLLGEIGYVWLDTLPIRGVEVPVSLLVLAGVLVLNALYVALFWNRLKLAVFDPDFAQLQGLRPGLVMTGLMALTSVTAVAAMDAVGAILFVGFVIVPAATARLLTQGLGRMMAMSILLAVLAVVSGQWLAFALDVSIGGSMALMSGVIFALVLIAQLAAGWARGLRRG